MPCEKTLPRCGIMWGNKQDDAPASGGTLQRRGTRKDKFRMHPHSNISPDKVEKNRQQKGEQHALAKLTDAQATEIRRRYAAGGVSQAQLAREYSINHATMGSLIHRKTWHHLP